MGKINKPSPFAAHADLKLRAAEKRIARASRKTQKAGTVKAVAKQQMQRARVSHKKMKFDLDGGEDILLHGGKPVE
jgi:hypothetical protein